MKNKLVISVLSIFVVNCIDINAIFFEKDTQNNNRLTNGYFSLIQNYEQDNITDIDSSEDSDTESELEPLIPIFKSSLSTDKTVKQTSNNGLHSIKSSKQNNSMPQLNTKDKIVQTGGNGLHCIKESKQNNSMLQLNTKDKIVQTSGNGLQSIKELKQSSSMPQLNRENKTTHHAGNMSPTMFSSDATHYKIERKNNNIKKIQNLQKIKDKKNQNLQKIRNKRMQNLQKKIKRETEEVNPLENIVKMRPREINLLKCKV